MPRQIKAEPEKKCLHNFALDAVDIHVCVYITEIIHTHTVYKGDADKL